MSSISVAKPDEAVRLIVALKSRRQRVRPLFSPKKDKRNQEIADTPTIQGGPCGYGIQRQLTVLGHDCVVVAPSLVSPSMSGDAYSAPADLVADVL